MAITLAEAKATLSTYVDNGVYPSDDRVIARINEAQRRLYAVRTWLGVLAKFSVPVNPTPPYTFTLPDYTGGALNSFADFGLTTALRVATCNVTAGLLTNSEQAFLTDNTSLVKVNRLSGSSNYREYEVSGINPIPSFVEVTGKLQFQPATLSTDLLIIQDLDALRLMLLGLWREQNGQLDLAQTFEAKAVERLSIVLDKTLEGARRVTYQTKVSGSQQGTMGYVRARMALDLKDGLHTDDAVLFHAIDRAEEHLMTKGKWVGTIKQFSVDISADGEIYLPTEIDSVLFASFNSSRINTFAREYDFHENGPGYRNALNSESLVLIDRGQDFVFDSASGETVPRRKYFVKLGQNYTPPPPPPLPTPPPTTFTVSVVDPGSGNVFYIDGVVQQTLSFVQGSTYIFNLDASVSGHPFWIKDNPAWASGSTYAYNDGVSNNGADSGTITFTVPSTAPSILYYHCGNHPNMGGTINISPAPVPSPLPPIAYPLTILGKVRFIPKENDNSYMVIQNYPALSEMVTAFMQAEKPDFFTFHENKAIELLRAELLEKRGGARLTMQVQGNGFAMGEIPHIL